MKYFYLLAALLMLNACGHIHHSNTAAFKLKRAEQKEKTEIHSDIAQQPRENIKASAVTQSAEKAPAATVQLPPETIPAEKEAPILIRPNAPQPPLEASISITPPFPDDSLEIVREAEEKLEIATKAEKKGKLGRLFGILSLVTMFTVVFSLLSVPFAIVGLINSIVALKAPYITDKGLRAARAGLITSIIGLAITVLVIVLIVLLILALI